MHSPATDLVPTPRRILWRNSVLVLDDDAASRRAISQFAATVGWAPVAVPTFADAEAMIETHNFDCIVSETTVGGRDVGEFFAALAALGCVIPVLIVGGAGRNVIDAAADLGYGLGLHVCYPIEKPLAISTLCDRLLRINKRVLDGHESCCHRDCHWRRSDRAPAA
ncbi:MAG: hypothetical protein HXX10_24790 [Rhodoplanes sp.]|uniref:hypothetical protein n=1 Tax=Rhodoplanes sp. TaxID=1968906 RepID=UPI00183FAF01|nr:hypothetical protein [Rhodoplanes sp.]NVO17257.1 hypothetical protein [Rhodoplanes sp.]